MVLNAIRPFLAIALLLVSACASSPSYDASAKETPVRVVDRQLVGYASREAADSRNWLLMVPVGKTFLVVTGGGAAQIPIYEYTVIDATKKTTSIKTEWSGYEPGQCLTLFTSNQPTYPRLASGAGCEQF